MYARFQLRKDSGEKSPSGYRECETLRHACELAVVWSEGQIGHPWQTLAVDLWDSKADQEDGREPVETYEIETADV